MKASLRGLGKIFAFTFKQRTTTKGYRLGVIIGVLLCLIVPIAVMVIADSMGGSAEEFIPEFEQVFVVDKSGTAEVDFNFLNSIDQGGLTGISYTGCGADIDKALSLASAAPKSLVAVIDKPDSGFAVSVLLPENTELERGDADALSNFLSSTFRYILMQKSGLDPASIMILTAPIVSSVTIESAGDNPLSEEERMSDDLQHIFSMIIGYILVMVIYFLVLIYGQGVANTVIMEKSSKLMELFLLSVDPGAMIIGKVLAVALSAAIQFTSWAVALICGFVGGTLIVKAMNPATDMMLISLFDSIGAVSGMFSVGGIIVALLILLSGFMLYCSLSAVGGALAGKPEDLSSTNILFTLVLVVSFFAIVFSGGITGGISNMNPVLMWIPFTGVLSAPSQLILGTLPILAGIGILVLTVVVSLAIMYIAGKLYTALVHHRGNPPALSDAFKMLKRN